MKITFTLLIVFLQLSIQAQELKNVAFAENDSIQLLLRDFCKNDVVWQESDDGVSWSDVQEFVGNHVKVNINDFSFVDKLLRAKIKYSPEGENFFSYPFSVSIIEDYKDIQIGDYYGGTFIYAEKGDTLLGGHLLGKELNWGCTSESMGVSGTSIGSGELNTQIIASNCIESAAAYVDALTFRNYDNWFVPSRIELENLTLQISNSQIDLFESNELFWSSSEHSFNETRAFAVYLGNFNSFTDSKGSIHHIPVSRYFTKSDEKINIAETILKSTSSSNLLFFERDTILTNIFRSNSEILLDTTYNFDWDFGNVFSVKPIQDNQYELEYKWNTYTGWHDYVSISNNSSSCDVEYISNTIKPEFFTKSQSLRSISKGDMHLADFDNDTQEDIVIAQSGILIYANDAGEFNNILTIPDSLHEPIVIVPDINNDGLADILIMGSVEGSPEVHSYLNLGEFQFQEIENPFIGRLSGDMETIDLNNDGILEILISGMDQDSVLSFEIYTYDNSIDEYEIIPSTVPGLFNCEIVVEDIDGDEDSDILILGKNEEGRNTLIFKNEEGILTEMENDIIALSDGDAAFFHFNDDEYLDLAVTGEKADVIVEIDGNSLNVDTRPAATFNIYTQDSLNQFTLVQDLKKIDTYYNSALDIGDYDSDGDNDLFISGGVSLQWCSKGIGGGTPPLFSRSLTSIYNKNNSDGFNTIKANTYLGFLSPPNYLPKIPTNYESKDIISADFNNDYKIDFIRGGNGGSEGNGGIALSTDLFLNTSSCLNLPPSQPQNISLIDSCNYVTINWNPSEDDNTSFGLKYKYYLKQKGSEYYVFSPANKYSTDKYSVLFKDLPNGEYVFAVKAIDGSKVSSPYSDAYSFTVQSPQTPEIVVLNKEICSQNPTGNYIWYFNGDTILGETEYCIDPIEDGEYFCVLIENGCTSDTSNVISYISTSVIDSNTDKSINIYPNPSTGVFQFVSEMRVEKIEVYNTLGQSVFKADFKQLLDLSWLAKGTYVLSFDGTIQRTIVIH